MAEAVQMMSRSTRFHAGRGGQMTLLAAIVLVATYGRTTLSPLQETIRIALRLSDNQMGLLQGPAIGLPMVIAGIPLGLLIDRYSRVRMLLAFALVGLAGSVLSAVAPNFALLFAARSLAGLSAVAVALAALSLAADFYPPERRGRATMLVEISQMVGISAAFAFGGTLLTVFGSSPNGWRWAAVWLAVPLALAMFLPLVMSEPVRTGVAIKRPTAWDSCGELWRFRWIFVPLLAGMIVTEMALFAVQAWAAPFLTRSFSLQPDRVGAQLGVGLLVSGIAGPILGGSLADYCQRSGGVRRSTSAVAVLSLMNAPLCLFAAAHDLEISSTLLFGFTTIVFAVSVMGTTLFTVALPNELRGLSMAIFFVTAPLFAISLAPVAVSLLSDAIGGAGSIGKALGFVCAAASVIAAMAFAFVSRSLRDTAPQPVLAE